MSIQAWDDPIVNEIQAIRERLAEQYQQDSLLYSQAAEARCQALNLKIMEYRQRQSAIGQTPAATVNDHV